ncbi:MAG: PAS domain S-box protein [Candidatus Peregrinibacteria bacterium]|nr:PAS domain S-box protein [Candidatus Peregrinibacteria bacterium]
MKASDHKEVFSALIDHMNEAVWVGNADEETVYANPKFCDIMGFSLEEMMGKKSYVFWTEESARRVEEVNTKKRKKGVSSSYEGDLLTKDKRKIPVLLSGAPLPGGGTVGIMTDLRELKAKEEQEQIFNKALQYSTDIIITFDPGGKIRSWNKGSKITFGYKADEIINSRLSKIFMQKDVQDLLSNSEIRFSFEMIGKHKNKKLVTISATLTPIFTEDKKSVQMYLLIARDITNQIRFEEDLALKYQKIREAYNRFGVIRRQMEYVYELLDSCEKNPDKLSIANFIVSSVTMLTRVDACVLRLYNDQKGTLDLLSSLGVGTDWQGKSSIKYKGSLAEKAFLKKTPLQITDITKDPKYQSKYLANKNNLISLLLIPLKFKGEPVGSLSLYARPEKKLEIFENDFIDKYSKLVEMVVATMF